MAKDAAEISPKLVPDEDLLPRDNSGGIDFTPYTQQWDDSGKVTGGDKAHLSATGGSKKSKGLRLNQLAPRLPCLLAEDAGNPGLPTFYGVIT